MAGSIVEDGSCNVAANGGLAANPRLSEITSAQLYHLPLAGSPAIGAGVAAHCPATDQIGNERPQGSPCVAGAIEYIPPPERVRFAGDGNSGGQGQRREEPAPAPTRVPVYTGEELLKQGYLLTAPYGLRSGVQFQRMGPTGVGNQSVVDMGFTDAIDVWDYVEQGVEVCFPVASGRLIFIDTSILPRSVSELPSYRKSGQTCGDISRPGIVVLVQGRLRHRLSNCMVTLTHILNFRESPGGKRIHFVDPWGNKILGWLPANVTLTAFEHNSDWFYVDYYGTRGWISADYVEPIGNCG